MKKLLIFVLLFASCKYTQELPNFDAVIAKQDSILAATHRIETELLNPDTLLVYKTDTVFKEKIVYVPQVITKTDTLYDCDTTPVVIPPTFNTTHLTFKEVIGLNASNCENMQDAYDLVDNQRVFYLIDHDLHGVPLKDRFPRACTAKCPNIGGADAHWNDGNAPWVMRMCDYSKNFKTITLDLETIYYPDGKGGIAEKKYPNKSLSLADMDGKPYEYGYKYGRLIDSSMSQFLDDVNLYIGVANEPHGSPDYETMNKWSKGMRAGLGRRFKLVSQDLQATGDDLFNGKLLYDNIKYVDTSIFDVIQTHSYIFDKNFRLSLPPEATSKVWMSPLQEMKDMANYVRGKELWLTEFGYDSDILGEETQSAYIIRTIVLAMRYGYSKAFIYALNDEPVQPFKYCGLVTMDGKKKQAYNDISRLLDKYGDYYFTEVAKETDGEFIYKFSNGKNDLVISWSVGSKTIPRFEIK